MKASSLLATLAATATFAAAAAERQPFPSPSSKPDAAVLAAAAAADAARSAQAAHASQEHARADARLALQGLALQLHRYADPAAQSVPRPTAAQLVAIQRVFGSVQPVRVEQLSKPGAPSRQRLTLPAGTYRADGVEAHWEPATWLLDHSADGRQLTTTLAWPQLAFGRGPAVLAVQGASADSKHRRGADGLWFGTTRYGANSVRFGQAPTALEFFRVRGRDTTTAAGKLAHQDNELWVERVKVGEFELEALHFGWRMRNLDRATLERIGGNDGSDQQLLLAQLKQLVLAGAELRIDDLSARYKGHTASLRGTVALPGAGADDLSSVPRLLGKLVVKADITVPLGLVRAAAATFASKNAAGPGADAIYTGIVGKATGEGWGRVEGKALRTTIDWNQGKLTVNGKPIALPAALRPAVTKLPPLDSAPARRVGAADRTPDDLLAHALNGMPFAQAALCDKEAAPRGDADAALKWCGKAAAAGDAGSMARLAALHEHAGDTAAASQWRRRAADAQAEPRDMDEKVERDGAETLRAGAGQWRSSEFAFDAAKRRMLTIDFDNPRAHEKSQPAQQVCVAALAPSDMVCLALMRPHGQKDAYFFKRTQAAGERNARAMTQLKRATAGQHAVTVFVRDDVVYFDLDGERVIAEPVSFPVQALQLGCLSADCRFRFPLDEARAAPRTNAH